MASTQQLGNDKFKVGKQDRVRHLVLSGGWVSCKDHMKWGTLNFVRTRLPSGKLEHCESSTHSLTW